MPHVPSFSPNSTHASDNESCTMPSVSPFSAAAAKLRPAPKSYRPAKKLPFELEEQVRIYLEESLYPQALRFLINFLTVGLSSADLASNRPAFIPPPSHLALISTLAVHPSFTTKTQNPDKHEASSLAIQYLNFLIRTIGPTDAKFGNAYVFPSSEDISRRGTVTRRRDVSPNKTVAFGDDVLSNLSGPGSLWVRSGDFWNIVGWAMNCSIWHKPRWERWCLWLEHVIQVLERDWEAHPLEKAEDSIIAQFSKNGNVKRIFRAVFANGKDVGSEFTEIWKHETREHKERKGTQVKEKEEKVKVDVENDEFGDYFDDSDSDDDDSNDESSDNPTPKRTPKESPKTKYTDSTTTDSTPADFLSGAEPLGGSAALELRMRLLGLLSSLSLTLPSLLVDLRHLISELHSHIRPFPLSTFALIIAPPSLEPFPLHVASFVVQSEACSLLESAAPVPKTDELTQEVLIKSFLPWAANSNSVADNAKLGACVETLIRIYDKVVGLQWSEELEDVVNSGIKRREEKAKRVGKRKGEAGTKGSEADTAWLRASGIRIQFLVSLSKEDMEMEDEEMES